jgi:hypothetical protein
MRSELKNLMIISLRWGGAWRAAQRLFWPVLPRRVDPDQAVFAVFRSIVVSFDPCLTYRPSPGSITMSDTFIEAA